MPYKLQGTTVINSDTGQPVPGGKHPTRAKALAHLRALMANVPEAKANYSAHAGQAIAGHLFRGAGGKFSASSAGGSGAAPKKAPSGAAKPKPKLKPKRAARGGKKPAPKPKAPKKTPEQAAAEHAAAAQQKIATQRQSVIDEMAAQDAGLAPGGAKALLDFADGKNVDPAAAGALEKMGLLERDSTGGLRSSSAGKQAAAAMSKGDTRGALDAISHGQDNAKKLIERQAKPKPAPKKSGGKRRARKPHGAPPRPRLPVPPPATKGALSLAPMPTSRTITKSTDGRSFVAQPGQAAYSSSGVVPTHSHAPGSSDILQRGQRPEATSTVRMSMLASVTQPLAVFKDARGQWRWIAKTTTAFEDRDNEIISTKALEADVTRADGDGQYGPLRWWHIGKPDPLDKAAPWGPGVDLGWADFNAMSGKTLIESGTFTSEAIARAVAAKADDLELSPGFFHAANEPDQTGVFTHIRRFERSLVPKWAGRASNRYTGLIVQGKEAMDEKKIQALKDLGIPETTIDALVADVKQTEKAAEADGVRYKEGKEATHESPVLDFFRSFFAGEQVATKNEPAPEAETEVAPEPAAEADPLATLKAQVEALTAEVKAFGKSDEPAKEEEVVVQEDAFGDAPAADAPVDDGGDAGGITLSPEDLAAIGQLIASALEPLIGALGITSKLEGHLGELKTMMGGYVKQKDDSEAQRTEQIAALKAEIDQQQAKLAELIGDEPRAGYRASAAKDNVLNPDVLAAIKDNNGNSGADFSDITQQLFPQLNGR